MISLMFDGNNVELRVHKIISLKGKFYFIGDHGDS
jgi:hypothetical protein